MQLISKHNKGLGIYYIIDLFSKYTWDVPIVNVTIDNAFQGILDNSKMRPNNIWVDQGSEKCSQCTMRGHLLLQRDLL